MKTNRTLKGIVLVTLMLSTLHPQLSTLYAQGTAFTYQGALSDNGAPASGIYDLRFTIYDAAGGGGAVGGPLAVAPTAVSNGLFTATLDFGAVPLNGSPRWLEVAVRTNGSASAHQALSPRQALTSTPYAFHAANAGTAMSVTGTVSSAVTFNNPANSFSGSFSGNGGGLSNVNAATLGGVAPSNFWQTGGNSGANPSWYLGTADYAPLELRVNGERAIRIEPATNGWPNLIGGALNNSVEADVSGAIVAAGVLNGIRGTSGGAAIGGGRNNLISTYAAGSVISGGQWNQLGDGSVRSVISGGYSNQIRGFTSTNAAAVARDITDGTSNTLLLGETVGNATIGGGFGNSIGADCVAAVISGGQWNRLGDGSAHGFIGGGSSNAIVDGTANTIIAGELNEINGGRYSVLAGGRGNTITGGTSTATIGGGGNNVIASLANYTAATIAGGARNWITNSGAATIGGGSSHVIQDNGHHATIAGGVGNTIETNAGTATISGGSLNTIQSDARRSTIGGGERNTVLANARSAVIGGGLSNIVGGLFATVPGGTENAALGDYSFAAGRRARASHAGTFVWGDSFNAYFVSTGSNQFLIRATGGVGIGKTNPAAALDVNGTVAATIFQGSGLSLSNVNATTVGGLASSNFWQVGGNAGTTPGAHFIGTTDHQPLELKVNGSRALRLEPGFSGSPNIIGGSLSNFVAPGVQGAIIAGGGRTDVAARNNALFSVFCTISGGVGNTILSNAHEAVIAGGSRNVVEVGAHHGTIGGGIVNLISGNYGTVPGGLENEAGDFSFAAGYRAKAKHSGSFVWTDTPSPSGEEFATSNTNQFLIRAGGGVGIGTTNPAARLTVSGSGSFDNLKAAAIVLHNAAANGRRWQWHALDDGRMQFVDFTASSTRLIFDTNGNTGIGTASPVGAMHVNGNVVIQSPALVPTSTSSSNLLNLMVGGNTSPVATNGSLNGISFYEGAGSKAMSLGYDGSGVSSVNALRIYHSSDAPLFTFEASGELGVGTTTPATILHVRDAGAAEISVESSDAGGHRWTLQSSGVSGSTNLDASFQIIDRTAGGSRLLIGTNGNVGIGNNNPTNRLMVVNARCDGSSWINSSDRNLKENFAPVDVKEVLEKVAALRLNRWNYKDDPNTPHLGPVAQDFKAGFGLGADDTSIATVDADGVALAAIQGLNQKVEALNGELKRRDAENAELRQQLNEIKTLLRELKAMEGNQP